MKIKFLGGAGEVGRSAMLVEDKKNLLFDYGIKVESKTEYPMHPERVDACFISHAHLDHSGCAPVLYKDGFPEMFATPPTMDLAELLIEDSIKIHRKKHEHEKVNGSQLRTMMNRYTPCEYGRGRDFGGYSVTMYDAGHICGSSITVVERHNDNRKIAYTGDFKLEPQLLEEGADIVKSDVLIMESTYAGKDHPERIKLAEGMVNSIRETVDNGGVALMPVFAVGRSQEMLALMCKYNLIDITYIDGMAKAATEIVENYSGFIKNGRLLREAIDRSLWIENPKNRSAALEGGSVILTTSGMLNGGPVLEYIQKLNKHSKIFLTGYQVENTGGDKLVRGLPLDIDGRKFRVKTPFEAYDFSAHAGKSDLHDYVKGSNPETVICVHGSPENTELLAEELRLEGYNAFAPKVGDVLNVDF